MENIVIPRLAQIDGALEHFADPRFQIVLRKAQQAVAATDRDEDYVLLSELLSCHVQNSEDRKRNVAVHKAIECVDQIDSGALCALTVSYATRTWYPLSGNCKEGIDQLAGLYSALMYEELPMGVAWIEHLEMLGAVRTVPFMKLNSLIPLEREALDGYVCVGIKQDSAKSVFISGFNID